jgi:hypothetical protein
MLGIILQLRDGKDVTLTTKDGDPSKPREFSLEEPIELGTLDQLTALLANFGIPQINATDFPPPLDTIADKLLHAHIWVHEAQLKLPATTDTSGQKEWSLVLKGIWDEKDAINLGPLRIRGAVFGKESVPITTAGA